jgi:serine/threonine-protein kinase
MADPLAELIEALRDRYRIDRELGRGGVATVFRAREVRHDRWVALKLLHRDLGAAIGVERFREAVQRAARLQHPHILAVHDSGEDNGRLWFTMPFIRGETLQDRIGREGFLPLAEALRIAREAADALVHAHREGVIHRDIKPENVLLSEGHALLADFGIARALMAPAEAPIGSPAYMSPEQATGAAVDARTDVYSLGAVLYAMLLGEPPFTGPTPQAVIARVITESPRPPRNVRASVPVAVEALTLRALARDPAQRFATAAELRQALDEAAATLHSGPAHTPTASATEWIDVPGGWLWPLVLTFAGGLLVGAGLWFSR